MFLAAEAARAQVSVSVPAPWAAQDVGAPTPAGSSGLNAGTFTISASGTDIWNTSDQFHFVYQRVSGDIEVVARIDSLAATNSWAKAGIMFRSSLAANALEVLAAVTPGHGVAFQHRATSGGTSVSDGFQLGFGAPRWVRLVRIGNSITAYHALDGARWTKIDTITLPLGATNYVGLAVTSHASGISTTATISNVSITQTAAGPVPPPQQAVDIGSPAIGGSTSYTSGVYSIKAGGTDIWNHSDQFHYVYQPLSGDLEIIARVTGLGSSNRWAKSGVMVRETLAAGSRHVDALVSAGRGYTFQRRMDASGLTVSTIGFTGAAPGWVRLVRTGNRFDAYRSTDGRSWSLMGSDTVPMSDSVLVGIAVTSHDALVGTTSTVDNLTVKSGASGNEPPAVMLTSPAAGASFTAPATIVLAATASDPENRLSHVDFYAGTTLLRSVTSAPYTFTWSSVAAGTYALTAVATDADGAKTTSNPVTVNVGGAGSDSQPPTAPATLTASPASSTQVTLNWAASIDNVGVAGYAIEWCEGTGCNSFTQLATSETTSYTVRDLTQATTYSFRVRAVDAAGNPSAYSPVASATTGSGGGIPKGIAFTPSRDHATALVTGYRLEVFDSSADPSQATPVATADLGKPAPANGEISVDLTPFFAKLAKGTYQATVSAYGPGGSSRSSPVAFTR